MRNFLFLKLNIGRILKYIWKILVVTSNIMQNMNNEYEENKIRKQALVNLFRFVKKILWIEISNVYQK